MKHVVHRHNHLKPHLHLLRKVKVVLQLGSFHYLSKVEPWDLTTDLKSHLQTPYAQLIPQIFMIIVDIDYKSEHEQQKYLI